MTHCRQLAVAHQLAADDGVQARQEDHREDKEQGRDAHDVDALPRAPHADAAHLDGRAVDEGRVPVDRDDEERHASDAGDEPDREDDLEHVAEGALVARQQRPADGVIALEADGEDGKHGAEGDSVLEKRHQFTWNKQVARKS